VPAATALAAIHRHPRHVVLFAVTAGLLLGPISPLATILAAIGAAAATAAAAAIRDGVRQAAAA
jgi:hypothetical protein